MGSVQEKNQEKTLHKYMLAFASLKRIGNGYSVHPAKLTKGFTEVIKCTSLATAKSLWFDLLNQVVCNAAKSPNRLEGSATLVASDLCDPVIVACLRDFKFLREALVAALVNIYREDLHASPASFSRQRV